MIIEKISQTDNTHNTQIESNLMGIRNQIKYFTQHKLGLLNLASGLETNFLSLKGSLTGSYSQSGEDIFVKDYFENKVGFYLDIGVNHPVYLSNTYLLYQSGWHGLTVEPIPFLYKINQANRSRDIQLNAGVDKENGTLDFFELIPNALSTFDRDRAERLINKGVVLVAKYEVKVLTLKSIFEEIIPGQKVDFLSIDTEFFDLQCLQGNDWSLLRPQLICCERGERSEISELLNGVGYKAIKNIGHNTFFELIS